MTKAKKSTSYPCLIVDTTETGATFRYDLEMELNSMVK